MEENSERNENERGPALSNANRWLVAALVALIVVAGVALGYGYRQQILVGHLTAQQSMANATIGDMQGQVNALTSKLNEVTAAQQAAAAAEQAKAAAAHSPAAKGPRPPREPQRKTSA